jgi:hypothetical protein
MDIHVRAETAREHSRPIYSRRLARTAIQRTRFGRKADETQNSSQRPLSTDIVEEVGECSFWLEASRFGDEVGSVSCRPSGRPYGRYAAIAGESGFIGLSRASAAVVLLSNRSWALWLLGYPNAAHADTSLALKDARESGQAAALMGKGKEACRERTDIVLTA